MQAVLLFLSFVSEFITSETGSVRQRNGLPVAWGAGVLVAAAIVLGTPGKAAACGGTRCDTPIGDCQYMQPGQCNYVCITSGKTCGECSSVSWGNYVSPCWCYH